MQVACERMGQIESQIQAQNAFVSGFMSGIFATFIVCGITFALMVWVIKQKATYVAFQPFGISPNSFLRGCGFGEFHIW
jgi:hypothetical protein